MKYQLRQTVIAKCSTNTAEIAGLLLPRISLGLWHNFGSVDDFGVATDMIKYALIAGLHILT